VKSENRLHINISDLLVEIISIVVAILLALAVNNWQEHQRQKALLQQSLRNITQEVEANAAALQRELPHHLAAADGFARLVALHSGDERIDYRQVRTEFIRTSPNGFHSTHASSIAWQIAQASRALDQMPYDERARLTRLYQLQDLHESAEAKVFDLLAAPAPAAGNNFFYGTVGLSIVLGDVAGTEAILAQQYKTTLAALHSSP